MLMDDAERGPDDPIWKEFEGTVIHMGHSVETKSKVEQGVRVVGRPLGTREYIKKGHNRAETYMGHSSSQPLGESPSHI